jgi:hypothetical protein
MVSKLRAAGAYDVIQYGAAWKDADAYLKEHVIPYVRLPPLPVFRRRSTHLLIPKGTNFNNLLPALRPPRHLARK